MFRTGGPPAIVILISIDEKFRSRAKILDLCQLLFQFLQQHLCICQLAGKDNFVYDFAFEASCQLAKTLYAGYDQLAKILFFGGLGSLP